MDSPLKHVKAIKFMPGRNIMPTFLTAPKLPPPIVLGARGTAQNISFFFFLQLLLLNAASE